MSGENSTSQLKLIQFLLDELDSFQEILSLSKLSFLYQMTQVCLHGDG